MRLWCCDCDCGAQKTAREGNLKSGGTQSCGCLRDERIKAAKTTHGYTAGSSAGGKRRGEYRVWVTMIRRCTNPKEDAYQYYGAKGITVCDRWRYGEGDLGGFECFISDIGERPSAGYSIDRIDNRRGYEPGNVRWATGIEQIRNRSIAKWVEWKGETIPLTVACEREGVPYANARQRLFQGWSLERTLTTPVRNVPKRPHMKKRASAS